MSFFLLLFLAGDLLDHGEWLPPRELFRCPQGAVKESSGLCVGRNHPGLLYTHDDSGGDPIVRGFDRQGVWRVTLHVQGALALDWEDIAIGPDEQGRSCLWVADIGDNFGVRPAVTIYRFPEPSVPLEGRRQELTVKAQRIDLCYPDGPRDAETLLVDPVDGRAYIVSKVSENAALYAVPRDGEGERELRRLMEISLPFHMARLTGGDFSPDGRYVALRNRFHAVLFEVSRAGLHLRLKTPSVAIPMNGVPAGEAITFRGDGLSVLLIPEGEEAPVHEVPTLACAIAESMHLFRAR